MIMAVKGMGKDTNRILWWRVVVVAASRHSTLEFRMSGRTVSKGLSEEALFKQRPKGGEAHRPWEELGKKHSWPREQQVQRPWGGDRRGRKVASVGGAWVFKGMVDGWAGPGCAGPCESWWGLATKGRRMADLVYALNHPYVGLGGEVWSGWG